MMMWFGKSYPAPAYADCPQTETPVGKDCRYCEEAVRQGDDGWFLYDGTILHRECNLRMAVGSVAHQEGRCTCFGGTANDEVDGMTVRQGAQAALEYFEAHGPVVGRLDHAGVFRS